LALKAAPVAEAPLIMRAARLRWSVLVVISLMYMITYMDRANISVTMPAMANEFGLSKTEIGLIFSALALAYALGQIPAASSPIGNGCCS
jgi:sugar phosphate permease